MTHSNSKQSDFDYLSLRKPDHKMYASIDQVLRSHFDESPSAVFTDNIQQFSTSLKLKD